jgi:transcriptional regulator with XRE-family HTH domain
MSQITHPPLSALRAERLLRGFSQRQIAEAVGVNQMRLSRIERGASAVVTPELAEKLAAALGCGISEIFGGDR